MLRQVHTVIQLNLHCTLLVIASQTYSVLVDMAQKNYCVNSLNIQHILIMDKSPCDLNTGNALCSDFLCVFRESCQLFRSCVTSNLFQDVRLPSSLTKPKKSQIQNLLPKELYLQFVSLHIGTLNGKDVFYEKVIIIKVKMYLISIKNQC